MLTASDLTVERGGKVILKDVNVNLTAGTGHGLVGPNGCGKTSLIQALLGVIPSSGNISKQFTSGELGVVWQDRCLPLNVPVSAWIRYLTKIFSKPAPGELFERFNIQNDSRLIRTLSGGEAQKIAIISAFFHNPKILILDEPTVGLDSDSRFEFIQLCSERISNGSSVLVTSHNSSDISAIANRITNLGGSGRDAGTIFSTSRKLTDLELKELAALLDIENIEYSNEGYLVFSQSDIFSILAEFGQMKNFSITSYSSLK